MENFDIEKGDLVLEDRAYGSIKSIRYCLEQGGDFIKKLTRIPQPLQAGDELCRVLP